MINSHPNDPTARELLLSGDLKVPHPNVFPDDHKDWTEDDWRRSAELERQRLRDQSIDYGALLEFGRANRLKWARIFSEAEAGLHEAGGWRTYEERPTGEVGPKGVLQKLDSGENRRLVRDAVDEVVEREGPIHHVILGRVVGGMFGYKVLRSDKRVEVLEGLSPEQLRHDATGKLFVWPRGISPESYTTFRHGRGMAARSVGEVVDVEIMNAIRFVLTTVGTSSFEFLPEAVAQIFGRRDKPDEASSRTSRIVSIMSDEMDIVGDEGGKYWLHG